MTLIFITQGINQLLFDSVISLLKYCSLTLEAQTNVFSQKPINFMADTKQINQRVIDYVNGYIRSIQSTLPGDNANSSIPALVIHWILMYYYSGDKFDSGNCAGGIYRYRLSGYNTIYTDVAERGGSQPAFLTRIANKGEHKWKFKLMNFERDNGTIKSIVFGVWKLSNPIDPTIEMFKDDMDGKIYGWRPSYKNGYAFSGKKLDHQYGDRKCRSGDIIEMILDLNEWKLRYTLNDKDQGICYENIEKCQYKAMIYLLHERGSVQLLSYSCKY